MQERIIYELLPPAAAVSPKQLLSSLKSQLSFLNRHSSIDAIVIPHIIKEQGKGKRIVRFTAKMPPREFAQVLKPKLHHQLSLIINKVVVYDSESELLNWTKETLGKYGVRHLTLVGGELPLNYPGVTVTQAAKLIKRHFKTEISLGGICIPHRQRELDRLWAKHQAGIDFFLTQVLVEAQSLSQLLKQYQFLCKQKQVAPKPIIITISPVTSEKNLAFLKWLQVYIPAKIEAQLKASPTIESNSFQLTLKLLSDISEYVTQHQIKIPLGINFSYIMANNINTTHKLYRFLKPILATLIN